MASGRTGCRGLQLLCTTRLRRKLVLHLTPGRLPAGQLGLRRAFCCGADMHFAQGRRPRGTSGGGGQGPSLEHGRQQDAAHSSPPHSEPVTRESGCGVDAWPKGEMSVSWDFSGFAFTRLPQAPCCSARRGRNCSLASCCTKKLAYARLSWLLLSGPGIWVSHKHMFSVLQPLDNSKPRQSTRGESRHHTCTLGVRARSAQRREQPFRLTAACPSAASWSAPPRELHGSAHGNKPAKASPVAYMLP